MRVLYVTGRQAAASVGNFSGSCDVTVMPVDVAALLSKTVVLEKLSGRNLSSFGVIVVPGQVAGDFSDVSAKLGVPVVKGPRHAADIPLFLEYLGEVEYSASEPADVVLSERISRKFMGEVFGLREKRTGFKIGVENPVYLGVFPHVVAEINDAPELSDGELGSRAKYFVESGASVIDLGLVSGENNFREVERIVSAVRDAVDVPVSVDSLNEKEILAGVDAGVDLVLSLCADNIDVADSISVPFVLIPKKDGNLPAGAQERIGVFSDLLGKVDGRDAILDPVLSPLNLGFVESVRAYELCGKEFAGSPLFFGAGNVTELIDADSVGVNAVLAGIAAEVGASLLFTVEASNKTQGCVRELSTVSKMAYAAKKRGQPIKDLGLDLLFVKDKRKFEVIEDENAGGLEPEVVCRGVGGGLDNNSFRIYVKDCFINVVHYENEKPARVWKGKNADDLSGKIVADVEVSKTHAAYLGGELSKAEIALGLGKNYVQDEPLF